MVNSSLSENSLLQEAIQFATACHSGQVRKGTEIPYITHPMETLSILLSMNADLHLLIAGVLHDTLEDTNATETDILHRFGSDVHALVTFHTEDKTKSWDERKQHAIDTLQTAPLRVKMLVMADKVANLRSLYTDYRQLGEALWSRFNAPKEKQAWYYSEIQDALYEMQYYPETKTVYLEMVALYKDLFVRYGLDEIHQILYQFCTDGCTYFLEKGIPQWKPLQKVTFTDTKELSHKAAEQLEELWTAPFWAVHELDLADGSYELFSSPSRCLCVELKNGELEFHGEDSGEDCHIINGSNHYEFILALDYNATRRFLVQLRLRHGIRRRLSDILKADFGTDNGSTKFQAFCDKIGIECRFFSF